MNITTRLAAAASTLALAAGLMAAAATPAQAAWGTDVTHAPDDAGYSAPIHAICRNGKNVWLHKGDSTAFGAAEDACDMQGVQRIVVGYDQKVYCKNALPPFQKIYFHAYGYNEVPSWASLKCWMQRP